MSGQAVIFNREGVRVMANAKSGAKRQQNLAHRGGGGGSSSKSSSAHKNNNNNNNMPEHGVVVINQDDAVTIDEGIAEAFGAAARGGPEGILKGLVLWGVPPFQKRVLLAGGANKIFLALAVWIPLFTHQKYAPPDCAADPTTWPAPEGHDSIAYTWRLCCGDEWKLAAINSAYFVGAFIGASFGGVLCDAVGRRSSTIGAVVLNGRI